MTGVRIAERKGYTVIPNGLLPDGLSARAWGVYAYLLSRPPGWIVRPRQLTGVFKEGRDAIYAALNELVQRDLLGLEPIVVDGMPRKQYVLHDPASIISAGQTPGPENPDPGDQEQGPPRPENPDPENQDVSHYRSKSPNIPTDGASPDASPAKPPAPQAGGCWKHLDGPGASCRACGTNARAVNKGANEEALAVRRAQDAEELRKARESKPAPEVATRGAARARELLNAAKRVG